MGKIQNDKPQVLEAIKIIVKIECFNKKRIISFDKKKFLSTTFDKARHSDKPTTRQMIQSLVESYLWAALALAKSPKSLLPDNVLAREKSAKSPLASLVGEETLATWASPNISPVCVRTKHSLEVTSKIVIQSL